MSVNNELPIIDLTHTLEASRSPLKVRPNFELLRRYCNSQFIDTVNPLDTIKIIIEYANIITTQGNISAGWIERENPSVIHINLLPVAAFIGKIIDYITNNEGKLFPKILLGKNQKTDPYVFKLPRLGEYLSDPNIDINRRTYAGLYLGIQAGNRMLSTTFAHELGHTIDFTDPSGVNLRHSDELLEMSAMDSTIDFLKDYIPFHGMLSLVANREALK